MRWEKMKDYRLQQVFDHKGHMLSAFSESFKYVLDAQVIL